MEKLPQEMNASLPSSPDRAAHREWIGGRALTLLSHYWRADDPVELTAAIGKDWADVLEGMPRDAIQKAAIQFQRDEPRRKPTPAAIYALAKIFVPKPTPVATPEPVRERITAERAAQIMEEAGFRPKRFGGDE